jgi:flagellin-like protein
MKGGMKYKKGVSPIIATVLLIAMVIVLGLIIFLWFRAFIGEKITKFDGENIELACADVKFSLRVEGNNIYIDNTGPVPIYSMKLQGSKAGTTNELSLQNWPDAGVNPGRAVLVNADIGNYDKITLIPILIGTGEKGHQTYVCDKKYGRTLE